MMSKSDVTNLFTMEDLIPVVADLSKDFTGEDSSSVTFARARQLMEAVIYCIAHFETGDHSLLSNDLLSAKEVYQLGFHAVMKKVKETHNKYLKLMEFFDHYGNRNYRDTVEKALPGFFLYYDVKYAPTEQIITMDYPVFGMDLQLEGIDRIRQYIDLIWEEQYHLKQFPRDYIIQRLRSFHPHYEREYFNLKEIILLHDSPPV